MSTLERADRVRAQAGQGKNSFLAEPGILDTAAQIYQQSKLKTLYPDTASFKLKKKKKNPPL